MSLTDALLLEPHPFEIWIAKHTDGLSRNCAAKFRGERATGPFCRATRPTAVRTTRALNGERLSCVRLGGRLPPRTGGSPVPPRPTASFRLSRNDAVGFSIQ